MTIRTGPAGEMRYNISDTITWQAGFTYYDVGNNGIVQANPTIR